jgi:YfiR/HmsC-like
LRRIISALLAFAILVGLPMARAAAQTAPTAAYRSETVRAGFLINFIRFTEWPTASLRTNAPFVIGIAGSRVLEDELLTLAEKQTVRDRPIHIIRVKTAQDLKECHVLYVSAITRPGEEPAPGAEELLPLLRGKPVLTVSESATFLAQGGIINLYPSETGSFRFEIASETARASGLVLSSRLLGLARIVNPPAQEKTP